MYKKRCYLPFNIILFWFRIRKKIGDNMDRVMWLVLSTYFPVCLPIHLTVYISIYLLSTVCLYIYVSLSTYHTFLIVDVFNKYIFKSGYLLLMDNLHSKRLSSCVNGHTPLPLVHFKTLYICVLSLLIPSNYERVTISSSITVICRPRRSLDLLRDDLLPQSTCL